MWRCPYARTSARGAPSAVVSSTRSLFVPCCVRRAPTNSGNGQTSAMEPLVVGNSSLGIRDNRDFIYTKAEFNGRTPPGLRLRSDADRLFAFLDIATFRAALGLILDDKTMLKMVRGGPWSMATVAFNAFLFKRPVFQGDLIRATSKVIFTGSSTLGVHVVLHRQSFDAPDMEEIGESFATMAVVQADNIRKTAKNTVPAVRLSTPEDIALHASYLKLRGSFSSPSQGSAATAGEEQPLLKPSEVELPENVSKSRKIPIKQTVTISDKFFGVKHINGNGAIFGGSVLRFLEQCALHCGRVFARDARVYTLGMMGMTFNSPIVPGDGVHCIAQVKCVRRSTMLVKVIIKAETQGHFRITNQADFLLISLQSDSTPLPIESGLDLSEATQEELAAYVAAAKLMRDTAAQRERRLCHTS